MLAVAQRLRIWVFSMEVPSLNPGEFSFQHFHTFYPTVTVLLEYFDPVIYNCLNFALKLCSCYFFTFLTIKKHYFSGQYTYVNTKFKVTPICGIPLAVTKFNVLM